MVLEDNPLQKYLFLFKKAFNLNSEEQWRAKETEIISDLYAGKNLFDIEFIFDSFLDHQITHGGNLFGFIVGSSGSGKSLTTLTIIDQYLIPKLFNYDHLSGLFNLSWTFAETQTRVRDSNEKGLIIQQDEVPRLIGGESDTVMKSWTNWMEQARGQRPFILFNSPTLWNLPNLHFALKIIPAKYDPKNPEYLVRTACIVAVPEESMREVKFRQVGYFFIDILDDKNLLKKIYFEQKEKNLEKNAKYGGARSAGWDQEKIERALQEIRDGIAADYPGEKILEVDSKRIKKIMKEKEIAAGSSNVEKELCSYILEEIEEQKEIIFDQWEEVQLKLIDDLIPKLDDQLPGDCKVGSIKQLFLLAGVKEKYLKIAKERFQLHRDLKEFDIIKNNRTVEKSKFPEQFWSHLVALMIKHVGKNTKLRKAIGAKAWQTKLEMLYYRRILNWKPNDIIARDEYKTIQNKETPRIYCNQAIDGLNSSNATKAAIGEEFFQQHFSALDTVFLLAAGKARRELFDSSISNQSVDFWLLDQKEQPVAILEVKFHFSRDEFVPSPGDKYAAKLGLPLFIFIIDARALGALIRFGKVMDFSREIFRVDTVPTISSMEEIVQILEKELGH